MKQNKRIPIGEIYLLTYGFQFTTDDKTQIEAYRNEGSKVKFLYKEDDRYFDCKTGEEIVFKSLPSNNPRKLDVVVDKTTCKKIYTQDELETPYVHSKGVLRNVGFKMTQEGGKSDPRTARYKILLPNILPIEGRKIFELTSFSYTKYLKILIQNTLPLDMLGKFEDKCNKFIAHSHKSRAEICKAKLRKQEEKNKSVNNPNNTSKNVHTIEMDGHVK